MSTALSAWVNSRRMVAIGYSTDRPHLHFFDEVVEKISEKLLTHFEGEKALA